jgi:hypothetical protein
LRARTREGDRLGRLKLTVDGLRERDRIVSTHAARASCPSSSR